MPTCCFRKRDCVHVAKLTRTALKEGLTHYLGSPAICTEANAIEAQTAAQVAHPIGSELVFCLFTLLCILSQGSSGLQEKLSRTAQS